MFILCDRNESFTALENCENEITIRQKWNVKIKTLNNYLHNKSAKRHGGRDTISLDSLL